MKYIDVFNSRTCNIFCDASIKTNTQTGETIGCPGCAVVLVDDNTKNEILMETPRFIIRNATNNISENRAILMSVWKAIQYSRMGYNINIFSDSQYCIYGFTKWIFGWVQNSINGVLYSTSGEVANQNCIKEVLLTIYNSGVFLNFYHQKGHANSPTYLKKAMDCFSASNGINVLDPILIQRLSYYNDMVDLFTKAELDAFSTTEAYNILPPTGLEDPFTYDISYVDMRRYAVQIQRRVRYV